MLSAVADATTEESPSILEFSFIPGEAIVKVSVSVHPVIV